MLLTMFFSERPSVKAKPHDKNQADKKSATKNKPFNLRFFLKQTTECSDTVIYVYHIF